MNEKEISRNTKQRLGTLITFYDGFYDAEIPPQLIEPNGYETHFITYYVWISV